MISDLVHCDITGQSSEYHEVDLKALKKKIDDFLNSRTIEIVENE